MESASGERGSKRVGSERVKRDRIGSGGGVKEWR